VVIEDVVINPLCSSWKRKTNKVMRRKLGILLWGCRAHGHQPVQAHVNRWESSFKLEIPEFQGCLQPEEFMDWIVAVGEILDFKGVLEDHNQILGKSSGTVATIEVIKCVAWKRKD
jgi:hypothetical protein